MYLHVSNYTLLIVERNMNSFTGALIFRSAAHNFMLHHFESSYVGCTSWSDVDLKIRNVFYFFFELFVF